MQVKLFIISSRFPYPLEKGDKLRLYHQIKVLSNHADITLISLTDQTVSKADQSELLKYCKSIKIFQRNRFSILTHGMLGFIRGLPAQLSYFFNPEIKKQIHQLFLKEQPDHIYCQLIRAAEYIKDEAVSKTIDYMDCFSLSSYKRSMRSPWWSKWFWQLESQRLKKYEADIYSSFDHHAIISSNDAESMRLREGRFLTIVSNGISAHYFETLDSLRDIDVLFLGNLSYFSNVMAVEFIVNSILPCLIRLNQSIQIVIAGTDPNARLIRLVHSAPIKVQLVTNIPDTRSIYQRTKVFVAPITLGTGQQNKVLEAIASGCAIVCSKEVCGGLSSITQYLSEAESPEDYAQSIQDHLICYDHNKVKKDEAKASVRHNFDWKITTSPLIELIKS